MSLRPSRIRRWHPAFFLLLGLCLSVPSCDIFEQGVVALEKIKAVLNQGVISLDRNSSSWQTVLQDMQGKLTADTASLIRNEVSDLLAKGIAASGAELRCDTDFVGKKMQAGLKEILATVDWELAKLIAQLKGEPPPPPPMAPEAEGPWLCTIVPAVLDRRAADEGRVLSLEGFGMFLGANRDTIKAFLVEGGSERDVTGFLTWPSSDYHVVLPLGAKGIALTDRSERIVFRWNGKVLSSVSIFQPRPEMKVCEQREISHTPFDIGYMPPHTAGDPDFDGPNGGPLVDARCTLSTTSSAVTAQIFMRAWEPKPDFTEATGTKNFVIYPVQFNWRILQLLGPTEAAIQYFDANHADDVFTGYGPVVQWDFRGDRDGDDAGIYTGVSVRFAPLRLVLESTDNCVPRQALRELQTQGLLSTFWQKRLQDTQTTTP